MRFGRLYHTYHVPGWENFYIRYNLLKRLLKHGEAPSSCTTDRDQVRAIFEEDVALVHDVYKTQFPLIDAKDEHQIVAKVRTYHSVEAMRYYLYVNVNAIQKILDKCSRYDNADGSDTVVPPIRGPAIEKFLDELRSGMFACTQRLEALRKSISGLEARNSTDPNDQLTAVSTFEASKVMPVRPLPSADKLRPRHDQDTGCLGKTAIYTAARNGDLDKLTLSLDAEEGPSQINVAESQRARTPLMIACIEGHIDAVRLLLDQGADPDQRDAQGWTAKELAAYRGHLTIAKLLPAATDTSLRTRNVATKPFRGRLPLLPRDRPNDTRIMISMGSASSRRRSKAVQLHLPLRPSYSRYPEAEYHMNIKLMNAHHRGMEVSSTVVPLPILDDPISQPWIIQDIDEDEWNIAFRFSLCRTNGPNPHTCHRLGVGVVQMSTLLQQGYSPGMEGLSRDSTVTIMSTDLESIAATVTFNFLILRHYKGRPAKQDLTIEHRFWSHDGSTKVIGHRGSGANTIAKTNLQLGENTVHSLASAGALGATAVEFDVQLTKDFVPCIYHNFLVFETGTEGTIWNMTESQFTGLSRCQGSEPISDRAESRYRSGNGDMKFKQRSRSVDVYDDHRTTDLLDRWKDTSAGKHFGIKGNLRGFAISDTFPTFEELLTKVPESVPFDLEMKYPMLWEAEDQGFEPYAVEANLFVDTVLELIYQHGGKRSITFSSFSPEICLLLSVKQQTHPILFLSKAGSVPTGDVRASSVQQALSFAKTWGLAGIVLLSDPLVLCPRLVEYVRSQSLVCASYGDLNDDPTNAKTQAGAGIDAIIVNKVKLISQTLARSGPS